MTDYRTSDATREWLSLEEFRARYQRADWKLLRAAALKRDEYLCTVCRKSGKLEVHHTPEAYASFGNEKLEDLVTLCRKHHPKGQYSRFSIRQDRQAHWEGRVLIAVLRWLGRASWWVGKKVLILIGFVFFILFTLVFMVLMVLLGPFIAIFVKLFDIIFKFYKEFSYH